jgi:hypothetical protein
MGELQDNVLNGMQWRTGQADQIFGSLVRDLRKIGLRSERAIREIMMLIGEKLPLLAGRSCTK